MYTPNAEAMRALTPSYHDRHVQVQAVEKHIFELMSVTAANDMYTLVIYASDGKDDLLTRMMRAWQGQCNSPHSKRSSEDDRNAYDLQTILTRMRDNGYHTAFNPTHGTQGNCALTIDWRPDNHHADLPYTKL